MAKYKHTEDVKIVLDDLENRVSQLMEVNARYLGQGHNDDLINHQNDAFTSVITLIKQVRDNGHVMRGNDFFPDPIEPKAKTKFAGKQQLGV